MSPAPAASARPAAPANANTEPPAEPSTATASALAPEIEMEIVSRTVRDYGNRFGGNPVGTNAEITKALDGGNPKGVVFLRPEQRRLNGNGELLDPWGTPYFFHQLSASEMETRSAGPDRQMWTRDDLVQK